MKHMQTYLMTSGELYVAAAASGMKNLLLFRTEEKADRTQQIRAVFRMVNEGFLISENGVLKPGAPLIPLLDVFRCATHAIVAKSFSCDSAPVCIYRGRQVFLCIAPHRHGAGLYEVSVFDPDALLDDLEARGLLPVAFGAEDFENLNAGELDGSIYARIEALDKQWNDQTVRDVFADELLSDYELYRLSDQASVDKLLIFKAPFTWCSIERFTSAVGPAAYSRSALSAWLKGEPQ